MDQYVSHGEPTNVPPPQPSFQSRAADSVDQYISHGEPTNVLPPQLQFAATASAEFQASRQPLTPSLWQSNADPRPATNKAVAAASSIPENLAGAKPPDQRLHPASLTPGRPMGAMSSAQSTLVMTTAEALKLPAVVNHARLVLFSNRQSMNKDYVGEQFGHVWGTAVAYLNDVERAKYKVTVQNGLVLDAQGLPFDTSAASTAFANNKGRAIFVMDHYGDIYVSNMQTSGKFHHSSFLAGAPVAAAGDIRIENGKVRIISRKSGHYQPTTEQLKQFENRLHSLGIHDFSIDENLS
ncbi:hypothetical protein ACV22V_32200 [Burkholderia sp. AW33-5]